MEEQLIAWIRQRLPAHPQLLLGPGDDAAILRLANGPDCVITVDMISEGVDFDLASASPRRVGRKALAINLSDLAAMAARPIGAVVALSLPRGQRGFELAVELYEGLLPLAEQFDLPIAGGDIQSWDGPLVICVTALGQPTARGPLRRSGAMPADKIVVTGSFGGSILGKHLDFQPRIHEALRLHEQFDLHAGMDVSDGLSLDLFRLATASGCGAVLELEAIPLSAEAGQLASRSTGGATPLDHALGDGEDFELLLAVAAKDALRMATEQPLDVPLTIIGEFVEQPGLWRREDGQLVPLAVRGYEH